jgi:hypothetical protein
MVFINLSGTPEGNERVRRLNIKARALDDQTKAHIKDFYRSLPAEDRSQFREYLRLRKQVEHGFRFAALCQRLGIWVAMQPAHSDVMQAGVKSLPTLPQLLAVVNEIEPLEEV